MTTGITFRNAKIEVRINGGAWTDISGQTNKVAPSGGDREIGTFYDAVTDRPTLGVGKVGEQEIAVTVKYTETAADAYGLLEAAYENADEVEVRWSPKGGSPGDWQFTSDAGFVKTAPYAGTGQEVEKGDPMRVEFTVVVPGVTRGTAS